jgi:hypothetical protein
LRLPDAPLSSLPLLQDALPDRLALYTSLTASIIAALWLSETRPSNRGRWLLATAAILTLPTTGTSWQSAAARRLADRIPSGSTVISLPFWDVHDRALELQTKADLRFALIDRWMQDTPPSLRPLAHDQGLYGHDLPIRPDTALTRTLCSHQIDTAIIWPGTGSHKIAHALGAPPPSRNQPTLATLHCPSSAMRTAGQNRNQLVAVPTARSRQ